MKETMTGIKFDKGSPRNFSGRFFRGAKTWVFGAILAGFLGLNGCATTQTTASGVVGVKRNQLMLVSETELEQAAAKSYRQILSQARKQGKLDTDKALLMRVQRITHRLIPQVRYFRTDALQWPWEVHVIDSPEINAWCMPGGRIVVYSGLVKKLKLTDDELAAILGHEIAHALREHARERTSQALAANLTLDIGAAVLGLNRSGRDLAGLLYQVGIGLPFSRLHEQEADQMGVELAARAGYDPYAAVRVWQKMSQIKQNQPPEFLSTHPSAQTRIQTLRKIAKKVYPLYLQAQKSIEK